jgi:hypothetical protein
MMRCKSLILGVVMALAWASPGTGAAPPAKNDVIPLIEMENVPLTDAIRQLARQARLNIVLDPRLSEAPFARVTISVRWQGVTAREALVALLDNYGLVLVE